MKTATVRDLRNHYARLLGWIEAGEEITVSRRGRVVARLVPEAGKRPERVDWETSAARRRDKAGLPALSAAAAAALRQESQGGFQVATVCCDTSFLFSLYARDAQTSRALAVVTRPGQPLTLTRLNEFELLDAVRFAVFRRLLPAAAGAGVVAALEPDLATGRLLIDPFNLTRVLAEAPHLSALRTRTGGHRSFDLLHVAAAVHLAVETFLTFDSDQRRLAKATGPRVRP